MAETSWPRPGYNTGHLDDTEYEQLAAPQATDGLVGTPADTAPVYADGTGTRQVKVRADRFGLVRGMLWTSGGSEFTKSHAANSSGQTRIDLVVLRLTRSTPAVTTEIVQGTPGAGAPALTQQTGTTGTFEIPLAEVTVINGATTITAGQVVRKEWYLGEPPVLCTAATMPPHHPGRVAWRTDGVQQISNGTNWITLYEDTGSVGLTPASGWSTSGGFATARRRSGVVVARWSLLRTGAALAAQADSTLFTLSSGYAPPDLIPIVGGNVNTATYARHDAQTSGAVVLVEHSGVGNNQRIVGSGAWVVS